MKYKRLPDVELEVMQIIWRHDDPVSTGKILQEMNTYKNCNHQVVQSTLNRLEKKSFVRCEKVGRFNYYIAIVGADEYRDFETKNFLEKMYANSPCKLFANLVQDRAFTPDELDEMRRILEEKGK